MTDARVVGAVLSFQLPFGCVEFPFAGWIIDHVVEVRQLLFTNEAPEYVHITVGHAVCRENVMIWDDDHFALIPHLGVLTEFPLEDTDGPRPAHIVGHEDVDIYPYIVAGLYVSFA